MSSLNRWSYSRAILAHTTRVTLPFDVASQPPFGSFRDAPPDKFTRFARERISLYSRYLCISRLLGLRVANRIKLVRPFKLVTSQVFHRYREQMQYPRLVWIRWTTVVSNDRHVYTSRYHHSLSLRREKKSCAPTFSVTPIPHQIVTSGHQLVTAAMFPSLPHERPTGGVLNARRWALDPHWLHIQV